MNEIFKIAAVCLVAVGLLLAVKKHNPEAAFVTTLAVCIGVLAFAIPVFGRVNLFLQDLMRLTNISPAVVAPLIKVTGVSVVAKVVADICRDSGESSVAYTVELTASLLCVFISLPLVSSVISLISGMIR